MTEVQKRISRAGLYEQLAEEAVELAHASLKKARILRGENPTPMISSRADEYVIEELTDVVLCSQILSLSPDENIMASKQERWVARLNGLID